jgi:DNA-binding response OmpR family regulator
MASIHAGIDEIIMKPMSPKYLVERVLARLAKRRADVPSSQRTDRRSTLRKRDWSSFGDNVVPLMRRQPQLERPL